MTIRERIDWHTRTSVSNGIAREVSGQLQSGELTLSVTKTETELWKCPAEAAAVPQTFDF